jgi:hypothetical protein
LNPVHCDAKSFALLAKQWEKSGRSRGDGERESARERDEERERRGERVTEHERATHTWDLILEIWN